MVNTLYNLTRIDRVRQEEAAVAGVIPHLQSFIRDNSPLKQFALGMLIDFSHLPKARSILSNYGGVAYFLQLLQIEEYWRGNLIDVISLWSLFLFFVTFIISLFILFNILLLFLFIIIIIIIIIINKREEIFIFNLV